MTTLHLIEGPVGAGKTTYAHALSHRLPALALNLDEWMVTLFQPDRPSEGLWLWYGERKQRCIEQIWRLVRHEADIGRDVIVELGLVSASLRAQAFQRADDLGCSVKIHLLDAPTDERAERVRTRNLEQGATFSMVVPDEIFYAANAAWEPLRTEELAGSVIELVRV